MTVVDDDDDALVKLLPLKRTRDEEETLRVDVLVVKRDEENESNARVADAILVCVCARAFCFVDYVISKRRDDVFPKIRRLKHFGRARVKTLSLSLSFSANVSNREWILGSVGITFNHVFRTQLFSKFMDIIAWYNYNERREELNFKSSTHGNRSFTSARDDRI